MNVYGFISISFSSNFFTEPARAPLDLMEFLAELNGVVASAGDAFGIFCLTASSSRSFMELL